MPYSIFITLTATDDIAVAIEYYNALSRTLAIGLRIKLQVILTASLHCRQPLLSGIKIFDASQ